MGSERRTGMLAHFGGSSSLTGESIQSRERTMRNLTGVVCSVLFAGLAWAQPSPVAEKQPATPETLKAEIEALKADKVAWREIAWKSCLIEGLKESREK